VTALLLATAGAYDYHRDELYFRMLGQNPAWGYVDQPPFTPLLSRLAIAVFGDTVWAIRIPSALIVGICAVLTALIAREVGGGRLAQVLAALSAFSAFPLIAGHTLATATPDLLVWLLVLLFAMRALLRNRPRYWLGVGLVTGLGLYNKHLVILLLLAVGVALLAVGPRAVLREPWLWAGVGVALVVGSPNLIYQLANDFPQAKMAEALAEDKGEEARVLLVPMQFVMLGPPMVAIWVAGLVTLWRNAALRPVRAFALAYPLMLLILFVISGQFYYTMGLLLALFAIGCVPTARWMADRRGRQALVTAAVVINIALSMAIALPLVPRAALADTPLPAINQVTRDQIGWRTYVRQVGDAYRSLPAEERANAVIITGNYGEAGAIDRYGTGLPPVYSGQNELWYVRRPADSTTVAILVQQDGARLRSAAFGSCTEVGPLDNGIGVENEEQEARIWVCRQPKGDWATLWPLFQHYS
jgi:4-amino-4-deoxy-L-arabinose transferase-like glycosyltransferase